MSNFLKFLLLVCGGVAVLAGQSAPVQPADPLIHVSVNLVQIEAVVTNSKQIHQGDLRPEEFQIFEDGVAQKITNFSYIAKPPEAARGPVDRAEGLARKLRPEEVRRAIALILDDIHTGAPDILRLRVALQKFVNEQIGGNDLVSLSAASGGMGFYEQFTNDRAQMARAVERLSVRAGLVEENVPEMPSPVGVLASCDQQLVKFERVMNKVTWAINAMSMLPGRKAVALFTGDFRITALTDCQSQARTMRLFLPELASLASRSGVAIYTFDARGLTGSSQAAGQEISQYLADRTGGRFFGNDNDQSGDLGEALNDIDGYYLIGYQPSRSDFELRRGEAPYHKITVKLRRPGLSVRYTKGFVGAPDAISKLSTGAVEAGGTRESRLREALLSPFDAGTLRVKLTPVYAAAEPDAKGRRNPLLKALLHIEGAELKIVDGPEGQKQLPLTIVVATFSAAGQLIAADSARHNITLTAGQARQIGSGLRYETNVPLAAPGPYQIRVAVHDDTSQATGSASGFVWIPDFNKSQLAVSSLTVSMPDSKQIAFRASIYGAKKDAGGVPRLQATLRIFSLGQPVFDSGFAPLQPGADTSEIRYGGNLQVPAGLVAGDYEMQVMVRDGLAKPKEQTVSQWAELTIAGQGISH